MMKQKEECSLFFSFTDKHLETCDVCLYLDLSTLISLNKIQFNKHRSPGRAWLAGLYYEHTCPVKSRDFLETNNGKNKIIQTMEQSQHIIENFKADLGYETISKALGISCNNVQPFI